MKGRTTNMMGSLDPQKMAQVQKVSGNIKGIIKVDYKEKSMTMTLATTDEDAQKLVNGLLEQMSEALATQLQAFFAINGEIREVNTNMK